MLAANGKPTGISLRSGRMFKAGIFSQNDIEGIADRGISQLSLIDQFADEEISEIVEKKGTGMFIVP